MRRGGAAPFPHLIIIIDYYSEIDAKLKELEKVIGLVMRDVDILINDMQKRLDYLHKSLYDKEEDNYQQELNKKPE